MGGSKMWTVKSLPPIGFVPNPARQQEGAPISAIVHSRDFKHEFPQQKQLDLGETVLDSFWLSHGPWTIKAKAKVYNKDQVWADPTLVLRANATDSSSEATANGGAGLYQAWEGECQLHTQSEGVTFVTCSIVCFVGAVTTSEITVWADRLP